LKYIPYEGPDEVLIFDTVIVEATTRNEVKRRKTENTLILLTAVIRLCLDFKATPNEKSHNCCLLIELILKYG